MGQSNGTTVIIIFITIIFLLLLFLWNNWIKKQRWRGRRGSFGSCGHGGDCDKNKVCIRNYVAPNAGVRNNNDLGQAMYNRNDDRDHGRDHGHSSRRGSRDHGHDEKCDHSDCDGPVCRRRKARAGDICFDQRDCHKSLGCIGGVCTPILPEVGTTCSIDADCAPMLTAFGNGMPRKCVGGFCTRFCTCNEHCPNGKKCVQGVCNPPPGATCNLIPAPATTQNFDLCLGVPCLSDDQCAGTLICANGRFGTENKVCSLPVHGTVGQDGVCGNDRDCAEGFKCRFGICTNEPNALLAGNKINGVSGAPCNHDDPSQCQSGECPGNNYWVYTYEGFDSQSSNGSYVQGAQVLSIADIQSLQDLDIRGPNEVRFLTVTSGNSFSVLVVGNQSSFRTDFQVAETVRINLPSEGSTVFSLIPNASTLAHKSDSSADMFYVVYVNNVPASSGQPGLNRLLLGRVTTSSGQGSVVPTFINRVVEIIDEGALTSLSVATNGANTVFRVLLGFTGNTPRTYYFSNLLASPSVAERPVQKIENAQSARFVADGTGFAYISSNSTGANTVNVFTVGSETSQPKGTFSIILNTTNRNIEGKEISDYAFDGLEPLRGFLMTDKNEIIYFLSSDPQDSQEPIDVKVNFVNGIGLADAAGAQLFIISNACE